MTGNVDRLATEQGADAVKQGQSEESDPVLEGDIIAAAKPSVSGA